MGLLKYDIVNQGQTSATNCLIKLMMIHVAWNLLSNFFEPFPLSYRANQILAWIRQDKKWVRWCLVFYLDIDRFCEWLHLESLFNGLLSSLPGGNLLQAASIVYENDLLRSIANVTLGSRIVRAPQPIGAMYGMFTYLWLISMVNVGKYTSPMDPSWVFMYIDCTNIVERCRECVNSTAQWTSRTVLPRLGCQNLAPQTSKHWKSRLVFWGDGIVPGALWEFPWG